MRSLWASPSTCGRRKKGRQIQALGRSRGGFGTKIHCLVDALGNPVKFTLTGGERADCFQALPLLEGRTAKAVLADKGYDAGYVVEAVTARGAEVVIPPMRHRRKIREYDRFLYNERNLIERMFGKLKHFRGIATRYNKLAVSFMAFIQLAAILLWLK